MTNKKKLKVYERSTTYRKIYFKVNKGIFHKWYLCAYCRNKFLQKDIVEVDHNIAVSAVKNKWYFRLWFILLGTTVNDPINLVASCRNCNRTKSSKTGMWIVRGAVGGVLHKLLQETSNLFYDSLKNFWWIYFLLIAIAILYLAYVVGNIL